MEYPLIVRKGGEGQEFRIVANPEQEALAAEDGFFRRRAKPVQEPVEPQPAPEPVEPEQAPEAKTAGRKGGSKWR